MDPASGNYVIDFDEPESVVSDNYDFVINQDGSVTAYHFSVTPRSVRSCMTEGEKVAVSFTNSQLKVVENNEESSLKVEKGRLRNMYPSRSEPKVADRSQVDQADRSQEPAQEPAPPPPPRTWFRVPGER